ncbi:collagen alpha-4(VI) chain-like [Physella acuta]|uniref:collagen alpha-4(VI) chain-like n=1 Tax=Physella acuta TaxID=109671 RepID=UPI0027DD8069|nr:collagen alpha-4(VI) chain-like [Physella acuta]
MKTPFILLVVAAIATAQRGGIKFTPPCQPVVDIVFLMVQSASIMPEEHKAQVEFLTELSEKFNVGPYDVQYSALVYSMSPNKLFDFKRLKTNAKVTRQLSRAVYRKGQTLTGKALDYIYTSNMFDSSSGARDIATDIVVMITDSVSKDQAATSAAAKVLRDRGVNILAIGVGDASDKELNQITGNSSNVFKTESYDRLSNLKDTLVSRICAVFKEDEGNNTIHIFISSH